MFTLRVGVSAWCTVSTIVFYLRGCTRGGCSCIFHGLDCSVGACEPVHYVCVCLYTMFSRSVFSFRRDVDQLHLNYYYITPELTVYL